MFKNKKVILKRLHQEVMNAYMLYYAKDITLSEYLREIKALDEEIDKIELGIFNTYFQDYNKPLKINE